MSPLLTGHCAVLALLALFLGFLLLALGCMVLAGFKRWKLGRALLAECHGDPSLAWAELRELREKNDVYERRLKSAVQRAYEGRDDDVRRVE